MDAFEEWVILHVLGTIRGTLPVRSKTFGTDASRTTAEQGCQSAVATTQQAADGGATLVIAALRRSLGARPIQEAVRLFRQLMGLRDMRRQPSESMRKWTSHFEAFIKRTGNALLQATAENSSCLHPFVAGSVAQQSVTN